MEKSPASAILPPMSPLPNPIVIEDLTIASICAPGQILAVRRGTGKTVWKRTLGWAGGDSLLQWGGLIIVRGTDTLGALDRRTGKVLWSFCPYGKDDEFIYAPPVIDHAGRLYIGDRRGRLHCIEAERGKGIWTVQATQGTEAALPRISLLLPEPTLPGVLLSGVRIISARKGEGRGAGA